MKAWTKVKAVRRRTRERNREGTSKEGEKSGSDDFRRVRG